MDNKGIIDNYVAINKALYLARKKLVATDLSQEAKEQLETAIFKLMVELLKLLQGHFITNLEVSEFRYLNEKLKDFA